MSITRQNLSVIIVSYKSENVIENCIKKNVDLSPRGIRNKLKLNNPIYVPTSSYGHFGRKPDELITGSFTWEKTDLVEMLKKEL